jgi:predicted enzyme related to lactoylglutathione lyase
MPKSEHTREAPKRLGSASIVWFEIPADNPERAKKFYGSLFGW